MVLGANLADDLKGGWGEELYVLSLSAHLGEPQPAITETLLDSREMCETVAGPSGGKSLYQILPGSCFLLLYGVPSCSELEEVNFSEASYCQK